VIFTGQADYRPHQMVCLWIIIGVFRNKNLHFEYSGTRGIRNENSMGQQEDSPIIFAWSFSSYISTYYQGDRKFWSVDPFKINFLPVKKRLSF
jgi:hypothetical protein